MSISSEVHVEINAKYAILAILNVSFASTQPILFIIFFLFSIKNVIRLVQLELTAPVQHANHAIQFVHHAQINCLIHVHIVQQITPKILLVFVNRLVEATCSSLMVHVFNAIQTVMAA